MEKKHPWYAWFVLVLSVGGLIAMIILQIVGCATPPKPVQYNPSAMKDCPSRDWESCREHSAK